MLWYIHAHDYVAYGVFAMFILMFVFYPLCYAIMLNSLACIAFSNMTQLTEETKFVRTLSLSL